MVLNGLISMLITMIHYLISFFLDLVFVFLIVFLFNIGLLLLSHFLSGSIECESFIHSINTVGHISDSVSQHL